MFIVFLTLAPISVMFLLKRKKSVKEIDVIDSEVLMDGRIYDKSAP